MSSYSANYTPEIDGLRAIAVIAIIIFHADFLEFLPGGFTGVDMFFVISGYVISQSLYRRQNENLYQFLKTFYRRRILRILPALLFMLTLTFILSALLIPQFWLSDQINLTGLSAFVGISNFVLAWNDDVYFSPAAELNPYLHTWSLGVEEQFYLIFPLIYFIWLRYKGRSAIVCAALPLLAVCSLVTCIVQTQTQPLASFYLLPSRLWEFAAGAMLYQFVNNRHSSTHFKPNFCYLLPIGLALITTGFFLAERQHFPFPWALLTVTGTLLMIAAVTLHAGGIFCPLKRILRSSVLTYIGRLSFSLYLWHWPIAVLFRWTIGFELLIAQLLYPIIVFMCSALSYHFIENPIRFHKTQLSRNAFFVFSIGIVFTMALGWTAFWVSTNTDRLSLSRTSDTYSWYAHKHYPKQEITPLNDSRINERQLFIMGDSHSAAYRTMLKIAEIKLGIKVIEYETGGCGVVSLVDIDPVECHESRERHLKSIEAQAMPDDIVFLASLRMPELEGLDWKLGDGPVLNKIMAERSPQKDAAIILSNIPFLRRLEALHVKIVIDAPKPIFKAPAHRCSDFFNKMNPVCDPGLTVRRAYLERLREPQMKILTVLKEIHPSLYVWDPFPLLCPNKVCSAYDNFKQPLFFDSNHLSGNGNRMLARSFVAQLIEIWTGQSVGKDICLRDVSYFPASC